MVNMVVYICQYSINHKYSYLQFFVFDLIQSEVNVIETYIFERGFSLGYTPLNQTQTADQTQTTRTTHACEKKTFPMRTGTMILCREAFVC